MLLFSLQRKDRRGDLETVFRHREGTAGARGDLIAESSIRDPGGDFFQFAL